MPKTVKSKVFNINPRAPTPGLTKFIIDMLHEYLTAPDLILELFCLTAEAFKDKRGKANMALLYLTFDSVIKDEKFKPMLEEIKHPMLLFVFSLGMGIGTCVGMKQEDLLPDGTTR